MNEVSAAAGHCARPLDPCDKHHPVRLNVGADILLPGNFSHFQSHLPDVLDTPHLRWEVAFHFREGPRWAGVDFPYDLGPAGRLGPQTPLANQTG